MITSEQRKSLLEQARARAARQVPEVKRLRGMDEKTYQNSLTAAKIVQAHYTKQFAHEALAKITSPARQVDSMRAADEGAAKHIQKKNMPFKEARTRFGKNATQLVKEKLNIGRLSQEVKNRARELVEKNENVSWSADEAEARAGVISILERAKKIHGTVPDRADHHVFHDAEICGDVRNLLQRAYPNATEYLARNRLFRVARSDHKKTFG